MNLIINTQIILLFSGSLIMAQNNNGINIIIRSDDMGLNHSSNIGCELSYIRGIATAVEVMAPCPYFMEAIAMLKNARNVEVGIHLTLNDEWSNYKWRPLTNCPSITDNDGYFFPQVWNKTGNLQNYYALKDEKWEIKEIEQELRAQIELTRKLIPQVNHISLHMGFSSCADTIEACVTKLAIEYHLIYLGNEYRRKDWGNDKNIFPIRLWNDKSDTTVELSVKATIRTLSELKPGNYMFIDHPAENTDEMRALGYLASDNVAYKREKVTKVFTSPEVIDFIKKHSNIHFVGYKDIWSNYIKKLETQKTNNK